MAKEIVKIHVKTDPLVIGRATFRSSNDNTLSASDIEIAHTELHETEEKKWAYLKELKEKLSNGKVKYRLEDEYLLRFLRVRKYNCKKALQNIKDMHSRREKYQYMFSIPADFESILNEGHVTYLPYTDEDGIPIIVVKLEKWKPHELPPAEFWSLVFVICDIVNANPHCQINGIKSIWDLSGMTWRHYVEIMRVVLFLAQVLQDTYPWRIRRVILINCSTLQMLFYRQLRFILKKKIYDRFKALAVGSDYSELHQLVNPRILPKQYGGTLDEEETNITQHVLENLPFLRYERSFVSTTDD